jgi:pimeloyl-ACP methyl ester carboxylesterase
VRGRGPAVLLIPGATGDSGHFDQAAEVLASEHTVIIYDQRGNSRRVNAGPMSRLFPSRERLRVAVVVLSITGAGVAACARMTSPATPGRPKMSAISSKDGTRIAYSRSGSGPPLVLVHGTTADHTRWTRLLPGVEQHFTVYAMDRRGRGGSGDAAEYDIEREFEDVAALIEAIREPVFLLGHSYGAICSLEASLMNDKVRRLILYEPPIPIDGPVYPSGVPERIQALVDAGNPEAALEVFFREVVRMPDSEFEVYRTLPAWKARITLAPTIPRELTIERSYRFQPDRFKQFSTPTLLLLGGDSPPMFRRVIDVLEAALPNSRIAVLPGQQHVAMDTAPELLLKELIGFLTDRP